MPSAAMRLPAPQLHGMLWATAAEGCPLKQLTALANMMMRVSSSYDAAGCEGDPAAHAWLHGGQASAGRDRAQKAHDSASLQRDALAVPAQAGTQIQGFVSAHKRLWQMEFQRRLGAGRLSEFLLAVLLRYRFVFCRLVSRSGVSRQHAKL